MTESAGKLTIVTVSMNRGGHLLKTAPLVSQWPHHDLHLVVDWSSEEPIRRADLPHDSRIRLVRVDQESFWSPSLAYNFAISLVSTEYVMRMDADCWPCANWNPFSSLNSNQILVGQGGAGRFGQFLMPLKFFHDVGGFNEYMRGWGFEDKDLLYRLQSLKGCGLIAIHDDNIGVIQHANAERVSHPLFASDSEVLAALRSSRKRNLLIAAYCPFSKSSPKSQYSKNIKNNWVLIKGSRPELSSWFKKKINESERRSFWCSYLALPEVVVEMLPVKLLPHRVHRHWPLRWWHYCYAFLIKPLILIIPFLLSCLRGSLSYSKLLFRSGLKH